MGAFNSFEFIATETELTSLMLSSFTRGQVGWNGEIRIKKIRETRAVCCFLAFFLEGRLRKWGRSLPCKVRYFMRLPQSKEEFLSKPFHTYFLVPHPLSNLLSKNLSS